MGEKERGESAPRQRVSFFCANGHEVRPAFALEAVLPDTWDCPRCGFPAGRESAAPPNAPRNEPYKTHLAYVRKRCSACALVAARPDRLVALSDRDRSDVRRPVTVRKAR